MLLSKPALSQIWRDLCSQQRVPPIDKWLESLFRREKKYGKRDRTLIRDQFFFVFRNVEMLVLLHRFVHEKSQGFLTGTDATAWLVEQLPAPPALPEELTRQLFARSWDEVVAASQELATCKAGLMLTAKGYKEDTVSSRRKNESKSQGDEVARLSALLLVHGVPLYFKEKLERRSLASSWTKEQIVSFVACQSEPAPLWLRVNTMRTDAETLALELADEQVICEPFNEERLLADAVGSVYRTKAFEQGFFEIQDWASQEIGAHVPIDAQKKMKVWDVCAGAGGKSLQLATAMKNKGSLYCTDIRKAALAELQKRSSRHELTNIRAMAWDGVTIPKMPAAAAKQGGYDVVFVDSPCSSSGTWRRNPESRYRMSDAVLKDFQDLQLEILGRVAEKVRPDGFLVYATCSWMIEENEDVVQKFLGTHGAKFTLESSKLHGAPQQNSDTMFSARFIRNGCSLQTPGFCDA